MSVELLPYEHVPPGFEIVMGRGEVCPGSKGGIWNLWWNVQLSDDPRKWDAEIIAINDLQTGLGLIDDDYRLIRAQMAEFCRVSPLFPESIDILCEEIGAGKMVKPYRLGCEGRNLLESLGYHDEASIGDQLALIVGQYNKALGKWLEGVTPETPLDSRVSGLLGDITEKKRDLVGEITSVLDSDATPCDSLLAICGKGCREQMGPNYDTRARPLHCLDCEMARTEGAQKPRCSCSVGIVIDAGILCTRIHDSWRALLNEYRRFAEEYTLAYSMAINSWLCGKPAESVTSTVECGYLTEEIASRIPEGVVASLGVLDECKVWLAACLLKTLKGNQRWHETEELIDGYPKATSYIDDLVSQ